MAEPLADPKKNTITKTEFQNIVRQLVTAEQDITESTSVLAAARGVKAGILRRAKKLGTNMEALKLHMKLAGLDTDDRRELLDDFIVMADWRGMSLWSPGLEPGAEQVDMFDDPMSAEMKAAIRQASIYSDGRNSAMHAGQASDNPGDIGSEDHQLWREGFDDFAAGRPVKKFGPAADDGVSATKTASAEKRPGKPKKAAPKKTAAAKPAKEKKPAGKPAASKKPSAAGSPFVN